MYTDNIYPKNSELTDTEVLNQNDNSNNSRNGDILKL